MTKAAAPDPVLLGNNLTYTVTVTNYGPTDPATGVTMIDTLPASVTFVSATPTQGTCNLVAGIVGCNLGNVAMATPVTIDIVVTPTQAGQITNISRVLLFGNQDDPTPGNDTAQVVTTVNTPPPPPPCTHALTLNAPTFRTGDTLALGANFVPWPGAFMADGYVSVRAPTGHTIFLQWGGTFVVTLATPMISNWTVTPFNGQIFAYTFAGNEPPGNYSVTGFFTLPGTFNPAGPQFCSRGFNFLQ